MARKGKIRALEGGGCSLCFAADENVGKRRCKHTLEGASMSVRHEKGMNFVKISGKMDDKDASFSIKASEKDIKNYITSLSSGLSRKDKTNILSVMRDL